MPLVIKKILFGVSILVLVTFLFLYFFPIIAFNIPLFPQRYETYRVGATFSTYYTHDVLGLDVIQTYDAILNDLGVRYIRIPIYWTEIEKEEGVFDFSVYDELLDRAQNKNVKVVLAIGTKLPRWPECFIPGWVHVFNQKDQENKIRTMLTMVVERYKFHDIVEAWQIENEPFFELFGECPEFNKSFYDEEIELVRSLDGNQKPIIVTDSGELGWWFGAAQRADIFGTTLYRSVWNKYFKHISYPWPPEFYTFKRFITQIFFDPKEYWVIELQAEPFAPVPLPEYSIDTQLRLMTPARLRENVAFSRKTGFSRSYLWGVEWWYWLHTKGHRDMWDAGKEVFKQ